MAVDPVKLQSIVDNLERTNSFRDVEALSYKVAQTNWAQEEELGAASIQKLFKKHKTTMKTGTVPPAPPTPPPAPVVPVTTIKPPTPKVEESPTPKKEESLPTPKYKPATQPPVLPSPKDAPPPKPAVKKEELPPTPKVLPPTPAPKAEEAEEGEDATTEDSGDEAEDKRYDDGGKGRKQCPGCKKYVGAKTNTCFCGHEFEAKAGTVTARREYFAGDQHAYIRIRESRAGDKAAAYGARNILWTPAGQPPVKPSKYTRKALEEWGEAVRKHEREKHGLFVCLSALLYWLGAHMQKTAKNKTQEQRAKICRSLVAVYSDEWAYPSDYVATIEEEEVEEDDAEETEEAEEEAASEEVEEDD